MDNNVPSPERVDEILGNIKPKIVEVNFPKQAKKLCLALPQMYTELTPVTHKFEIQKAEALEQVLALLWDVIIDKDGFVLANELMEKSTIPKTKNSLHRSYRHNIPQNFKFASSFFRKSLRYNAILNKYHISLAKTLILWLYIRAYLFF